MKRGSTALTECSPREQHYDSAATQERRDLLSFPAVLLSTRQLRALHAVCDRREWGQQGTQPDMLLADGSGSREEVLIVFSPPEIIREIQFVIVTWRSPLKTTRVPCLDRKSILDNSLH